MGSCQGKRRGNGSVGSHAHGFSLIEVAIASGIATLMILLMTTFFVNMLTTQRQLERRAEISLLMTSLTSVVSAKTSCTRALQGQAFDGPVAIRHPSDASVIAARDLRLPPDLVVEKVRIEKVVELEPNKYFGNLTIAVVGFRPREVSLVFDTVANDTIIRSCHAMDAATRFQCITGEMNGKTLAVRLTSNTTEEALDWSAVLTRRLAQPGNGEWGLTCQDGWSNAGCGYSDELVTGVPDRDIRVRDNGCFSDDEEVGTNVEGPMIYATCCRLSI